MIGRWTDRGLDGHIFPSISIPITVAQSANSIPLTVQGHLSSRVHLEVPGELWSVTGAGRALAPAGLQGGWGDRGLNPKPHEEQLHKRPGAPAAVLRQGWCEEDPFTPDIWLG